MSLLITLAAFVLAIGVLVSFHEFGHYWVAKRCGVKVLTFSIGFGQPLLRWQRGETQWQIAAIPLGGYVKMLDEREEAVDPSKLARTFNRQSVGKRMAIVVAGPVANFLFAICLYWGIFLNGVVVTIPHIGSVAQHSVAAKAGFSAGDTILAVDGERIDSWSDARMALVDLATSGDGADVLVKKSSGEERSLHLDFSGLDKDAISGDLVGILGLSLRSDRIELGEIIKDSAAARAGLQTGDHVLAIEGVALRGWGDFVAAVQVRPGVPSTLSIRRNGAPLELRVTPDSVAGSQGKRVGRIGAASPVWQQRVAYGPWRALKQAVAQTWTTSVLSIHMMWRMITGHVSYKQLSGPVAIAGYAGQSAKAGIGPYLEFLCLISISLGVLNLLPVPLLDGGHLMYYSAELLRGRPVSERVMELGQRVGVGLLAALMMVALFNDISRLVGS